MRGITRENKALPTINEVKNNTWSYLILLFFITKRLTWLTTKNLVFSSMSVEDLPPSLPYDAHHFILTNQSHFRDYCPLKTPLVISSLLYCLYNNITACNKLNLLHFKHITALNAMHQTNIAWFNCNTNEMKPPIIFIHHFVDQHLLLALGTGGRIHL